MYCSLVTSVSFAFLSVLLFRVTFEGCKHSFATLVSWRLFEYLSKLYREKTFGFLLTFFSFLGKWLSRLVFFRGFPSGFYLHCYPLVTGYSTYVDKTLCPCKLPDSLRLVRLFVAFKRALIGFFAFFTRLLNKPLNYFNVFGFFGVMVTVRLFFLVLLVLALLVSVKYFSNLLKFKSFKKVVLPVVLPSLLLSNLLGFLTRGRLLTLWYLAGSGLLSLLLYHTNRKHLLKSQ